MQVKAQRFIAVKEKPESKNKISLLLQFLTVECAFCFRAVRAKFMRFGRGDPEEDKRSKFMRFGRSKFMRFGRSKFMRFGRSKFMRFGRSKFMRFGRDTPKDH